MQQQESSLWHRLIRQFLLVEIDDRTHSSNSEYEEEKNVQQGPLT